jgi:hypothetical protein
MALIPPHYLDCVVAIGADERSHQEAGTDNITWIGTGFLVGRFFKQEGDSTRYHVFLVTNKHVFSDRQSIILQFNPSNEQAVKTYHVKLTDGEKVLWTGHPTADAAVALMDPHILKKDERRYNVFRSDQDFVNIDKMASLGISEGDFVYILGYPLGLVDQERHYVIVRSGVIARIRDVLERRKSDFIIDASVFPGSSGGPVITKPEIVRIEGTECVSRSYLIGIVHSYISYVDSAISAQTQRVRVTFEENSGLARVTPSEHILEAVEAHFNRMEVDADGRLRLK